MHFQNFALYAQNNSETELWIKMLDFALWRFINTLEMYQYTAYVESCSKVNNWKNSKLNF